MGNKYGNPSMRKLLVLVMTSLSVRTNATPEDNQCEWHTQVCQAVLLLLSIWREIL